MAEMNGMAYFPPECPLSTQAVRPFDEEAIFTYVHGATLDDEGAHQEYEVIVNIYDDDFDCGSSLIHEVVSVDDPMVPVYDMVLVQESDFKRFICDSVRHCPGLTQLEGENQCGAVNQKALEAKLKQYHSDHGNAVEER